MIQGIGLVTCVYVNPETHRYWIVDYRIYDIDRDGKTKLQHLQEMLRNAYFVKHLPFRTVLVDSWYASMKVMKAIEALSKIYYAPLKCNRLVNDSDGVDEHKRVDALTWTEVEHQQGKLVHIRKFPKGPPSEVVPDSVWFQSHGIHCDQRFISIRYASRRQQECRVRWKIEQLHRELKQTTGISECQSRRHRGQTQSYCVLFYGFGVSLTRAARATGQTVLSSQRTFITRIICDERSKILLLSSTLRKS